MFLAVDIGNTNIVIAIFDDNQILNQWRISTDSRRTGDEYFSIITSLLRDYNIDFNKIKKSLISSVVPNLIGSFVTVCQRITGTKPYVINPSLAYSGELPVKLPIESQELGTDLLSNAVSAWNLFHCANIVVDFGTALTMIVTDSSGIIRGVTITPGLGTAIRSLSSNTAQLPDVPLKAPDSILGLTTVSAIQSGIVLGYKGLVEFLISNLKNELCKSFNEKIDDIKVVATGGLNSVLKPITDVFTIVDKDLTVKGLKIISDFMQK